MDFSAIFQLRTKKFWWMDVILYFVISLLIATALCYFIFLAKNSLQRENIQKETAALQTVGTDQQKEYEKEVINYQREIKDFSGLLTNHELASNVFAFMQMQTMPNIWFKQFGLDEKSNVVQLSGESDDMDAFSRQVVAFEKNKYVESIGTLTSSLGDSARIEFNIDLALDQNIFSYLASLPPISETVTSSEQPSTQPGQTTTTGQTAATSQTTTTNNAVTNSSTNGQAAATKVAPSSEKLITSFDFLSLNPEIIGVVDETNYAITLNVPYGTDVRTLTPSIVISPGATVLPASDLSQNFTSPVTYMVTAQDGSTQNYIVKVIVAASPETSKKSSQSGSAVLIIIVLVVIVAVIAVIILFAWKKMKGKK